MPGKKEEPNPRCSAAGNERIPQPCEGPLTESAGYYRNGRSDFRCEKHARWSMTMNPFGPTYRPMKRRIHVAVEQD